MLVHNLIEPLRIRLPGAYAERDCRRVAPGEEGLFRRAHHHLRGEKGMDPGGGIDPLPDIPGSHGSTETGTDGDVRGRDVEEFPLVVRHPADYFGFVAASGARDLSGFHVSVTSKRVSLMLVCIQRARNFLDNCTLNS